MIGLLRIQGNSLAVQRLELCTLTAKSLGSVLDPTNPGVARKRGRKDGRKEKEFSCKGKGLSEFVFYGTPHLPLNISAFISPCVCVWDEWVEHSGSKFLVTQYFSFNDIPSSSVCIRPFSFYCIFPVFILLSISVSLMVIFLFYISVFTFLYFSSIDLSQCFPTQSCCCTHRK